ncbi:MAG TPA: AraC family transcriptional regulator [Rudaea sp.]
MPSAPPPKPASDPRFTAAVIPTTILTVLAQVADDEGIAVEPWLTGLGLTRAQIDDADVRVSYRQASLVIRRALKATSRTDLGLEVGRRQNLGSFGVLGLAMMTARTFGEAMAIGIEHNGITGTMMDLELEMLGPDHAALLARPRFPDDEILIFLCEELFASSLAVCRGLLGAKFNPARVELTYAAPPHAAEYGAFFQCDMRFGARHNRAVVDRKWLLTPLPTHHPISAKQALAICREQQAQMQRQSEVVASVERILRRRLHEHPTLEQVARTLNLTERTLRRHLAAAGRVYRDIHDRIRTERALELLHAGSLSIADIGSEVGFSDPREFRRAFKRWTGMAPRTIRMQSHA